MRHRNSKFGATREASAGIRRQRRGVISFGLAAIVFAGCGETEVTQAPPPTQAARPAATTAVNAADALSPADAQDAAPVPIATFGDLAERIDTAWRDVRSYRTVFTAAPAATSPLTSRPAGLASPEAATPAVPIALATPPGGSEPGGATPAALPPFEAVRLVVLPDRQRQTLTGAGHDDHEAIVAGEVLYLRGPLAAELVPGAATDVWLSLPLADLAPESAAGHVLAGLAAPPASPLASLREGLRPQELRDLGAVQVDDRVCHAYGGADTTAVGTRQDITIAIDDAALPCLIETRVGRELVSRIVYDDFNEAFTIDPPADATPVAGLLPPATPVGRD